MTSEFFEDSGKYKIKALRGKQGDRTMYLTLPSLSVLGNFFHRGTEEPPETPIAQRPYDEKRADEIADSIEESPSEYVLGALTYALDVEGEFQEVVPGSNIGNLMIPYEATLSSVDGQHRAGGVRDVMKRLDELKQENVAILIYVEPKLDARRQMFSDMNFHQKRVSNSQNVAFESRDSRARAARGLAESHPLLKGRIEAAAVSVRAVSETCSRSARFTTPWDAALPGSAGECESRLSDRRRSLRMQGSSSSMSCSTHVRSFRRWSAGR